MIDTKHYAFFIEEGYEILADLADWQNMSRCELADVARRYAVALEQFTEPDKRDEPVPQMEGNLPDAYPRIQCPFTVEIR